MLRGIPLFVSSLLIVAGMTACQPIDQPVPTDEQVIARASWCQDTVNAMKALTNDLPPPDHLYNGESRRGDEFDPNSYFSVIQHLSMEPGYVLDFVYYYDGFGGWPIFYARQEDNVPYQSVDEYMAVEEATTRDELADRYLSKVQTDGTLDSFLELALLHLLGNQFYLYWHAGYFDTSVICDEDAMADLLDQPAWYQDDEAPLRTRFPQNDLDAIHQIDLEPQIRLDEDGVHVSFIYLTHWGGFQQLELVIGDEYPHAILDRKSQNLVEYQCGVTF